VGGLRRGKGHRAAREGGLTRKLNVLGQYKTRRGRPVLSAAKKEGTGRESASVGAGPFRRKAPKEKLRGSSIKFWDRIRKHYLYREIQLKNKTARTKGAFRGREIARGRSSWAKKKGEELKKAESALSLTWGAGIRSSPELPVHLPG